jgi:glycerophosphoryl diester phosphodiesterase
VKPWLKRSRPALIALALVSAVLSLVNASWLAPRPPGRLTLVANRGISQRPDPAAAGGPCAGSRIEAEEGNNYIENTLPSIYKALKLGAQAVRLEVQRTRDGQAVIFQDPALDCRTNGHGAVRDHMLAELKTLDVGYGYTPDKGASFPLRGRGVGAMPTVEAVLQYVPAAGIVFAFINDDPAEADALVAAFGRAGVRIDDKYGFAGPPAVTARLRQLAPGAWIFDPRAPQACIGDYMKTGWTSFLPASCRGTTLILPIDQRWKIWGWPYRFFDRIAKAKSRMLITGPAGDGALRGLDQPEQYDQVPADFHGDLLVEDNWTMGPSLRR